MQLGTGHQETSCQCRRRSRSASSSKGFAVPFLDTLLGSPPTKALAKKAAALPAALTNGGGAVAPPVSNLSSKGASEAAALDAGKQQALDLQPSYQPIEPSSSSASALEASAASSTDVEGVELHSMLPLTSVAQMATQPQVAVDAPANNSAAKLVHSTQGEAPKAVPLSSRVVSWSTSLRSMSYAHETWHVRLPAHLGWA